MCQNLNLSWKIAVQNVGCISIYFVADTKLIYGYNFVAPLKYSVSPISLIRDKCSR